MIRPAPLRPGDVVRVVAPSGPVDPEKLARGVAFLREELELDVRVRPDILARRGYLAGDDARRLEEWHEAVGDRQARALFCARGGYGAMRLLPRMEAGRLFHPARWVVGFSDVTALHAALNRAGLVTLHAPLVTTLASSTPETVRSLRTLLFGEPGGLGPDGTPSPGAGCPGTAVIRPGRASGTLLGGSLTLLAHLCGTKHLPSLAGAVLFIEDVAEKPYRLDRYLMQLKLAGALDGVRAVALGHFVDCDDGDVRGLDVVRDLVHGLGVPAIEGLPVGHDSANWALPLGSVVALLAPGPGEAGPPRLLFDAGARAG